MNRINFISVKYVFIILIVSFNLIEKYNFSLSSVKLNVNGVIVENPCNTEFLSQYYNINNYSLTATKGSDYTQSICPNLKFSCCNDAMIKKFANDVYNFKTFYFKRKDVIMNIFKYLTQYTVQDFKDYIDKVQEKDIECYNNIQEERIDDFKQSLSEEKKKDVDWKKLHQESKFDKSTIISNYSKIVSKMDYYTSGYNEMFETNLKFSSSIICAMCSPSFSKILNMARTPPVLHITEDLCKNVIKNKVNHSNLHNIYFFIKDIVFLSHCLKKNSLSNKNFGNYGWKEIDIVRVYTKKNDDITTSLISCYAQPDAFEEDSDLKPFCLNECSKNLNFPFWNKTKLKNFVRAKLEIYNIFFSHSKSRPTQQMLDEEIEEIEKWNKIYEEKGTYSLAEDSRKLNIYVTKPLKSDFLNLKDAELKIKNSDSLNYRQIDMKIENLKFVNIQMISYMLMFLTFLFK